ncbi:MAG: hypothetical protein ACREGD_03855 [Candidatus Saccharimonadales bacterium]
MDPLTVGGLAVGVLSLLAAIYYGQKTIKGQPKASGHQVKVTVSNGFPVYDLPSGRQEPGDHFVMVDVVNLGDRPIAITGWGIKLPGDKRMVITRPPNWSTPLPHVLRPGEPPARFAMPADEVRRAERERGIAYEDMWPYVALADGQEIRANKSVLLA